MQSEEVSAKEVEETERPEETEIFLAKFGILSGMEKFWTAGKYSRETSVISIPGTALSGITGFSSMDFTALDIFWSEN